MGLCARASTLALVCMHAIAMHHIVLCLCAWVGCWVLVCCCKAAVQTLLEMPGILSAAAYICLAQCCRLWMCFLACHCGTCSRREGGPSGIAAPYMPVGVALCCGSGSDCADWATFAHTRFGPMCGQDKGADAENWWRASGRCTKQHLKVVVLLFMSVGWLACVSVCSEHLPCARSLSGLLQRSRCVH